MFVIQSSIFIYGQTFVINLKSFRLPRFRKMYRDLQNDSDDSVVSSGQGFIKLSKYS